jgi:hypothetical protein
METTLPPRLYTIIYKLSFLILATFIYAIYKGHYILSIVTGGAFLTSINYWRKPNYSWRYYLDTIYIRLAIVYHMYRAYMSQFMIEYYIISFLGLSFYPISVYCFKQKRYWTSTFSHCAFHIISNIALIVLYSGQIL